MVLYPSTCRKVARRCVEFEQVGNVSEIYIYKLTEEEMKVSKGKLLVSDDN